MWNVGTNINTSSFGLVVAIYALLSLMFSFKNPATCR